MTPFRRWSIDELLALPGVEDRVIAKVEAKGHTYKDRGKKRTYDERCADAALGEFGEVVSELYFPQLVQHENKWQDHTVGSPITLPVRHLISSVSMIGNIETKAVRDKKDSAINAAVRRHADGAGRSRLADWFLFHYAYCKDGEPQWIEPWSVGTVRGGFMTYVLDLDRLQAQVT